MAGAASEKHSLPFDMFRKIPIRVSLLLCLLALFTAWNLLRAWTARAWQEALQEFSSKSASGVIFWSGAVWALLGLILFWGIWQEKAWAKRLLLGAAAGYTVWYWAGRLLWQMPRPNWLFAVILNLVLIIFIVYTTKSPLREAYEREP